jgi:EmrB/QacA subfamily drug resistance transporter
MGGVFMSEASVPAPGPDPRRWWILAIIGIAQLMVVLDLTVMNLALPSAQHALHFNNVDRQWIVTAYALSFGSLLLFCGRLADLFGRKVMFITGLSGFAVASAIGGASVNFTMLVTARACQGVFAAMLAPAALSLLTTTFSDAKERGKAFGIYGTIAGAGAAVGLLLGGALTSYLSWRWCLYINVVFAGVAIAGGAILLHRQPRTSGAKLDIPGVLLVSGGVFCLVYGFSNAATHGWSTPSTYGFLAVGVLLLIAFGVWQARAAHPLLPPRVVLDRNRGGAYIAILIVGAGIFGIFLFLTYYMQVTLGYSAVLSGVAFLPLVVCIAIAANVGNIVLMPRIGPKPIVIVGMLALAGAQVWLTRIGLHGNYAGDLLGPLMITGFGMGFMFSTALNAGTYGVAPYDAGVASASVNTGQQLGGSIGTSLLNTIAASATTSYIAAHIVAAGRNPIAIRGIQAAGLVHGYTTVFWWCAAIFLGGAIVCGSLMRRGPLQAPGALQGGPAEAPTVAAEAGAPGRSGDLKALYPRSTLRPDLPRLAGSASCASRGSVIVKRVMPGRLVTSTAPPCAATTASTIARPSPVEEALVACDREVSARVNRSNRSGSRSGGTPGPSSVTVSTIRGPGGMAPRLTDPGPVAGSPGGSSPLTATVTVVPSGVCRPALLSTLPSTWRSRCSSPLTSTGSSGSSSIQRWSGLATRESLAASMASRVMSTGSRLSGRPASSLASNSRSSTRTLIRVDSDSTRPSACVTASGESPGCSRPSSA